MCRSSNEHHAKTDYNSTRLTTGQSASHYWTVCVSLLDSLRLTTGQSASHYWTVCVWFLICESFFYFSLLENVEGWLKYLRNELPTIAFKSSTQTQQDKLSRSKVPIAKATGALLKSSACLGAEVLMKLLGNYSRSRDLKTAIRVGVVGE